LDESMALTGKQQKVTASNSSNRNSSQTPQSIASAPSEYAKELLFLKNEIH